MASSGSSSDFNPYYAPPGSRQPAGYDPSWSRSPYFSLAGEDPGPDPWQRNDLVQQQAAQQRTQQQPQQAAPTQPYDTSSSIMTNPTDYLTKIGAAVTGQPMVVNPTPQPPPPGAKGGVYSGAQRPIVSSKVPTIQSVQSGVQGQVPGLVGGQAQPGSQFAAAGPTAAWTPSTYGSQPIQPATAASAQQGQPFATAQGNPPQVWATPPAIQAPSAPSIIPPTVTGGQPAAWGIPGGQPTGIPPAAPGMGGGQVPAPFTGNVDNDPYISHAVAGLLGLPSNPWHNADGSPKGASVALGTSATPQRRAAGGRIIGSTDTVPAMLTPGEYVINRAAAERLGKRRLDELNQPVAHMQSGGSVDDNRPPREVPRAMSTDGATTATSSASSKTGSLSGENAIATMNNLATNLPNNPSLNMMTRMLLASQGLKGQEGIAQSGGSAPGLGQAAQTAWNAGINPNAGLPVGASGYVNAAGQQIAPTPGTAGYSAMRPGMPTMIGASAIGSVGSAISDAFNKYAQSVGSWKWKPSAIPTPDQFRRQQQVNLQQENVT